MKICEKNTDFEAPRNTKENTKAPQRTAKDAKAAKENHIYIATFGPMILKNY